VQVQIKERIKMMTRELHGCISRHDRQTSKLQYIYGQSVVENQAQRVRVGERMKWHEIVDGISPQWTEKQN